MSSMVTHTASHSVRGTDDHRPPPRVLCEHCKTTKTSANRWHISQAYDGKKVCYNCYQYALKTGRPRSRGLERERRRRWATNAPYPRAVPPQAIPKVVNISDDSDDEFSSNGNDSDHLKTLRNGYRMRNAIGYGSFFSTGRTVREENSNKQSKRSLLLEGGVARVKPQRPKTLERHQTPAIKIERRDIVTVVSHAEPREHAARIMDLLGAEIMSQFANIQAMQACMEHVLNHARRLVKAEHGNDTSVYLLEQVIKAQFSLKADGFKLEETMIIIEKCRKHIDSQWTSGSLS